MFMPFLGLHSFQDSSSSGFDAGLRIGALVGGFATGQWSLNAGMAFDVFNPNSQASDAGLDISGKMLDLTFSPLFHIGNAKGELVIGPKLGGWVEWVHVTGAAPAGVAVDATAEGWTLGGNMGGFLTASPTVLVGILMTLELREPLHACASATNVAEMCTTSGLDSATMLGFTIALML